MFFLVFIILLSVILGAYIFTIVRFASGWDMIKEYDRPLGGKAVDLSCVIAFRDEYECIPRLIEGLKRQTVTQCEILLVDDGSTDGSFELASLLTAELSHIRLLKNEGSGKKAALTTGVRAAQFAYVVFTDADCVHPPNWLRNIAYFLGEYNTDLLVGPVKISPVNNRFHLFQCVDFLSLVSSALGSIGQGKAIMCNGANLVVKKEVWLSAQPQLKNEYASGDDIFLMQFCVAHNKTIRFLKNRQSVVETYPQKTMGDLLKQRVRWASKSKGYTDLFTLYVAWLVFLSNLLVAMIPVMLVLDLRVGLWAVGMGA